MGLSNTGIDFGLGLGLAIALSLALSRLAWPHVATVLSLFLAAIGAVYLGSALTEQHGIVIESGAAILCYLLALMRSHLSLGAGYLLHGGWDWLHHGVGVEIDLPAVIPAYPPLCVGFDWGIACFIGWQWWQPIKPSSDANDPRKNGPPDHTP